MNWNLAQYHELLWNFPRSNKISGNRNFCFHTWEKKLWMELQIVRRQKNRWYYNTLGGKTFKKHVLYSKTCKLRWDEGCMIKKNNSIVTWVYRNCSAYEEEPTECDTDSPIDLSCKNSSKWHRKREGVASLTLWLLECRFLAACG